MLSAAALALRFTAENAHGPAPAPERDRPLDTTV